MGLMMKKLALFLCMVPAFASAQGYTAGVYPAVSASFASGRCILTISDFQTSIETMTQWIMNQSQHGFKEATFFGCYSPITNTQAYRDVRDDLIEGGYSVSLNNTTNTFTVTWP